MRRFNASAELAIMMAGSMRDQARIADEAIRRALADQHPRPRTLPLDLWPRILAIGGGKRAP